MRVLVIEDNDILRENIVTYLNIKWIYVKWHGSYEGSMLKIVEYKPDVIVLDLGLGSTEWDGRDICKGLREKWNNTPILILTARNLVEQKIEWLNIWADDYMVKPFDYIMNLLQDSKHWHEETCNKKEKKYKYEM